MRIDQGRSPRRPPADPALRARDEKIESIKNAIGKLAHDFNNLLAPQLGYIGLLREDLTPGSPTRGYADTLELAARKAEKLIETIMLAVRPNRKFRPEQIRLDRVLAAAVSSWRQSLPATVTVDCSTDPFPLLGDPSQWNAVFAHLLANAALATSQGRIAVSLTRAELTGDEMIRLGLAQPNVARIIVRDSGSGMTPESVARAFEPFFTTRAKADGLGLTIVHAITHLHGGQVELASNPSEGTTVTLWVPERHFS